MEISIHQHWSKLTLLMVFLCTLSSTAASKDFYRWEDSEGVTHYSSVPPKDAASTKVRATNTKAPADGYNNPAGSTGSNGAETAAATQPSAEQQEKSRQLCEAAQKNAKTLQEKNRIRIKDDQGEYRYLDTKEIAAKLKDAQQVIEQECR